MKDLAYPYFDQAGQLLRYVGTTLDGTESKGRERALLDAQEQLRRSEQRWQFALEGGRQGVWDWDMRRDTVYYSPEYKRMLGYAADEPFPTDAAAGFARFHPDDLAAANAAVERHLRGEVPFYSAQFRVRCRDGSYIWVESRGMVVERTPDGAPARMIGTHADITDRRRITDAVVDAEARLRLAIEGARLGTFDWNVGAGTMAASDLCRELFGLPRGIPVSREHFMAAVHADDRDRVAGLAERAGAARGGFKDEFRVVWRNGPAQRGARAPCERGRDRQPGQDGVPRHELLTPLNGIMGMTGLALRRATDPKVVDYLAKAQTASKKGPTAPSRARLRPATRPK